MQGGEGHGGVAGPDVDALARALGITPETAAVRLDAMGLGERELAALHACAPAARAARPGIVEAMYARLREDPESASFLGGEARQARLAGQLARYLEELFAAEVDWPLVLRQLETGLLHHRVRLPPQWYLASNAHLACDHLPLLRDAAPTRAAAIDATTALLGRLLLDASLTLDAYGMGVVDAALAGALDRPARPGAAAAASGEPAGPRQAARPAPLTRVRLTADVCERRRRHVGLGPAQVAALRLAGPIVTEVAPAMLDDFYAFLAARPETAALVPGPTIDRLKQAVATSWLELAASEFDRPYAASRARIGVVHERLGVTPQWYLAGVARQLGALVRAVAERHDDYVPVVDALVRAVAFDLTFVMDAYLEARAEAVLRTHGYEAQLLAGLASAVAIVDGSDRVRSANAALLRLLGIEPGLLRAVPLAAAAPIPGVAALLAEARADAGGRASAVVRLGARALRATAMRLDPSSDADDGAVAVVLDDVTEIARIARDLEDDEGHLDDLIQHVDGIVWQADAAGTITTISQPVVDLTGVRDVDLLGKRGGWLERIPEPERSRVALRLAALAPDEGVALEHRFVRADGEEIWLRSHVRRRDVDGETTLCGVSLDVTAARLEASRRDDAVGQLAGGMAHEINNALTVVLGGVELIDALGPSSPLAARALADARRAAEQAGEVTARLLAFAGRQMLRPRIVAPADVVRAAAPAVRALVGAHVEVALVAEGEPWPCRIDPDRLRDALLALAANAGDAMPGGGRLRLETRSVPAGLAEDGTGCADDRVEIVVADDGAGMAREALEQALVPFFTTKPTGGTGLGLSMVQGFVRQSGGSLQLASEPGRGTTVRLLLPRAASDVAEEAPSRRGPGTVLVVDDNEDVRETVVLVLRRLGYEVVDAATAEEALAHADTVPPAVLVCDVVLGAGPDGITVARQMRQRLPELAVVLMSGYAASQLGLADAPPDYQFLPKPLTMEKLDAAIRAAVAAVAARLASP